MKRLVYLILGTVFFSGTVMVGCGGGGSATGGTGGVLATGGATSGGTTAKSIQDLVPRANDVAGFAVNPTEKKTASLVAAVAKDSIAAEALINGSAAAFYAGSNTATLAWQNYIKSDGYTVSLYIWEMPTVERAQAVYAILLTPQYPMHANNVWGPLASFGDEARLCNTGTTWWINIRKGNYMVEVQLNKEPSGSEESDTQGRDLAKDFAAQVLKRF